MVDRGGLENRCALAGTQGSNPCLSAIKPDYQAFVVYTPNFTPCFGREIGCFGRMVKKLCLGVKIT